MTSTTYTAQTNSMTSALRRHLNTIELTDADVRRFWEKVDSSGGEDACWEWTGARYTRGYGVFRTRAGKQLYANRVAYTLEHGAVPEGMFVCHHCDNPSCCNPAHLFAGTPADNSADMVAKERQARGERSASARLTEDIVRQVRARIYAGEPQNAIATAMGLTNNIVSQIAHNRTWEWFDGGTKKVENKGHRGKHNGAAVLTEDDVRTIRKMLMQGMDSVAIAKRLGLNPKTVNQVANNTTWAWLDGGTPPLPVRQPRRGEEVGAAKLTSAEVAHIRQMLADGITGRAIAREFGVSTSTISLIRLGRIWMHVEADVDADEVAA